MRREDIQFLAEMLRQARGLLLTPARVASSTGRLNKVAERFGFASVGSLMDALRSGEEDLAPAMVEAMTVRDTSFFRDRATFDLLRDTVLTRLRTARLTRRRLSIWSAACGTGQEAYSLAMVLADLPQFGGWDIEILASDASPEALTHAQSGLYSQAEIKRGLPGAMLGHFRREEGGWRVSPAVQRYLRFEILNLLDSFAGRGPFDLILCRNVLMYFDAATKADILDRLAGVLADDGYLLLGSAETLLGTATGLRFESNASALAVKAGPGARSALVA